MNSLHNSATIYNCLKKLKLGTFISDVNIKHIIAIMLSVFTIGFKGKTVNFASVSDCHRTTVAHFLNKGKWDSDKLLQTLKSNVVEIIYNEARRSRKPIYLIVDDTIASHTKPSSKAIHPIEDAYFHMSHLKGHTDYGHQAVGVMLSCNGVVLNYDNVMYDKTKSKIEIVKSIIDELPEAPVVSYFLCDSWYTSAKLMAPLIKKGFYTIGALKTNRIIYPYGIRTSIKEFASFMRKQDPNISLVTAGGRQFYVYRYEGKLNDVENAVVLITYPQNAFQSPNALRAFISTDVSLSTEEILMHYVGRWQIELFFCESKNKLAFDKYQVRSAQGIKRYWLIMSLTHFVCCTCAENGYCNFTEGYKYFCNITTEERLRYIYKCVQRGISFDEIWSWVA